MMADNKSEKSDEGNDEKKEEGKEEEASGSEENSENNNNNEGGDEVDDENDNYEYDDDYLSSNLSSELYSDYDDLNTEEVDEEAAAKGENEQKEDGDAVSISKNKPRKSKMEIGASSHQGSEEESGSLSKRSARKSCIDGTGVPHKSGRGSKQDQTVKGRSSRASGVVGDLNNSKARRSQLGLGLKSSIIHQKRASKAVASNQKPQAEKKSGKDFLIEMEEKRKKLQNVNTDEILRNLLSKELKIVEERKNQQQFAPKATDIAQGDNFSLGSLNSSQLPPRAKKNAEDIVFEPPKLPKDANVLRKELEKLNHKMGELGQIIQMKEMELEQAHIELFETHGESNIE